MKERPILFSAPMVRAIMAGVKTQTRRVVKHAPWYDRPLNRWFVRGVGEFNTERDAMDVLPLTSPYGQPGDRLWVREAWHTVDNDHAFYRANYAHDPAGDREHGIRWKPSIHMPRWASRITLDIVAVRVERLQDISEADAVAEGAEHSGECDHARSTCAEIGCMGPNSYRGGYADLWEKINGPGSWAANPWVWVVEFRVVL